MDYWKLVQDVIEEHKVTYVFDTEVRGEYNYPNQHKQEYVRTVIDIDNLYKTDRANRHILEIGSFLGTVSISLKRLGYKVSALDIPEFQKSPTLGPIYEKNGIDFVGLNLRYHKLPYPSDAFDAVVITEVIEHLNFNPLRVLMEINRILKIGGYIYIGMPNQASYANRKKLLFGKSIHNSIDDFFSQLDRKKNMIVGLHWREYTMSETTYMIERMGFQIHRKYYFGRKSEGRSNPIITALKTALKKLMPFLLPSQVVIGQKVAAPNYDFLLTEANT